MCSLLSCSFENSKFIFALFAIWPLAAITSIIETSSSVPFSITPFAISPSLFDFLATIHTQALAISTEVMPILHPLDTTIATIIVAFRGIELIITEPILVPGGLFSHVGTFSGCRGGGSSSGGWSSGSGSAVVGGAAVVGGE